jgi:hypothetical protein
MVKTYSVQLLNEKATRNMNSDWKLIHGIIVSHWSFAGKTILQRAKILNSVI